MIVATTSNIENIEKQEALGIFSQMLLIRRFEEEAEQLYKEHLNNISQIIKNIKEIN